MAPEVRLLDARPAGLGEEGLRAWARRLTAASGAAHVARSYRWPWALVAWDERPVGVDVERVEPADRAFAASIATPAERGALPRSEAELARWTASLWSSKEALAKALGDALAYDPRRLEAPMRWPRLRAGAWRAAPVTVPPGHVGWVCWRAPAGQPL
jgi:hypothetical protein